MSDAPTIPETMELARQEAQRKGLLSNRDLIPDFES